MMRRWLAFAAFGLLLSVGFGAGSVSAQGGQDVVAGTAMFPDVGAKVHVDAQSGPSGENAHGHWRFEQGYFYDGTVTCLAVSGNSAIIGGSIDSTDNPNAGAGFLQYVQDNGSPGRGDYSVTLNLSLPAAPTDCTAQVGGTFIVGRGNYVVKDAQP